MAKKKKKKNEKTPPEVLERAGRAAADVLESLPTDDPAGLFAAHGAGLDGRGDLLAEALGRAGTREALNFLHQLTQAVGDKATVKAARKAIYRLEQAGLEADEEYRRPGPGIIKPPPPRKPVAAMSAYDYTGMRMAILATPEMPSGYNTALFIAGIDEGLAEFNHFNLGAAELRRIMNAYEEDISGGLYDVPPEAVRLILAEAAGRTREKGRPLPDEYQAFISGIRNVPLPEKPLIYDHIPLEEAGAVDLGEEVLTELLDHDALTGFNVLDDIGPVVQELGELDQDFLVLTDSQRWERIDGVVDKAEKEIFPEERRALWKRQLEETALLLWCAGEEDLARAALASALDVSRPFDDLTGARFTREVLDRTLALASPLFNGEIVREEEGEEDGLKRTESGIILPSD